MEKEARRAEAEVEAEGELGPYRCRCYDLYMTFGRSRDGGSYGDKKVGGEKARAVILVGKTKRLLFPCETHSDRISANGSSLAFNLPTDNKQERPRADRRPKTKDERD